MDVLDLIEIIDKGEDSTRQFKEEITSADALAAEISAFANTKGGVIIVGVSNNGNIAGLSQTELRMSRGRGC